MTSEELEGKYPHWKDALFGNHNAVANLRCAVHYVFWHGVYGAIAAVTLALLGVVSVAMYIASYLGPLKNPTKRTLERIASGFNTVANHEYTEKIVSGIFIMLFVAIVSACIGMVLYAVIFHFWMAMAVVVQTLLLLGAMVALMALYTYSVERFREDGAPIVDVAASKARAAGEKAVKTPGVRRVYGECPVSMKMAPKWFENLFGDK